MRRTVQLVAVSSAGLVERLAGRVELGHGLLGADVGEPRPPRPVVGVDLVVHEGVLVVGEEGRRDVGALGAVADHPGAEAGPVRSDR